MATKKAVHSKVSFDVLALGWKLFTDAVTKDINFLNLRGCFVVFQTVHCFSYFGLAVSQHYMAKRSIHPGSYCSPKREKYTESREMDIITQ